MHGCRRKNSKLAIVSAIIGKTAVRFFFARARREAQFLSVPLLWIQDADDINGLGAQPKEEQAQVLRALLRHWNIHDTAHLHTLLPAYVGQRVRLTEKISADHRLVQESRRHCRPYRTRP